MDSEDSESEEDEDEQPELEAALINHNGCVNRIRVRVCLKLRNLKNFKTKIKSEKSIFVRSKNISKV